MEHDTKAMLAKGGISWSGVTLSTYLHSIGVHNWGDAAAFVAFIYTLVMLGDWGYKKWKGRKR